MLDPSLHPHAALGESFCMCNEGSVTDRNLVRLFEILESGLGRKTMYTFEYFRILYFNYHEILFGIWNLCQKTVRFGILYRNLVGVRPLDV